MNVLNKVVEIERQISELATSSQEHREHAERLIRDANDTAFVGETARKLVFGVVGASGSRKSMLVNAIATSSFAAKERGTRRCAAL